MAHKTIKDLNHASASTATPTHVYDPDLKSIYTIDSHRHLLHARENEPNDRWWSSWHDHLADLLEAKQRSAKPKS